MARRFRTFQEAWSHLAKFTNYERMGPVAANSRSYNLERVRRLLAALGSPQEEFASLHIAGTKGKGSVALFAEAMLREQGVRTGLYTSPHLIDVMERIQVGGRPVRRRDFVEALNAMRRELDRVRPTFFETMTAAAFRIFARRGVEVAVVEVGLGGRLDATNVLTPAACAITPIALDHTAVLGGTLERIAREKAGILKRGVPLVLGRQEPRVERFLLRAAERAGAPLLAAPSEEGARSVWRTRGFMLEWSLNGVGVKAPVAGAHQADNAATALALVRAVAEPLPSGIRRALRAVRLPGRIEHIRCRVGGRGPVRDVVLDVAHNPSSARALRRTLDRAAPGRPRVLVFGTAADKDFRAMLAELMPGARLAVFTRSANPRAADPRKLARAAGGKACVVEENVARAVRRALREARGRDLVVVAGSFAVAGEAAPVLRLHE